MKNAFNGFVNTLIPATPSFFSVTYFNTQAYYTLQTLSDDASIVTGAINNVPAANEYTNWQDGLHLAAITLANTSRPGLIVFASDGQPNRSGNPAVGSGSSWTSAALYAAINEANIIKDGGTRIITLGLGAAVSNTTLRQNLIKISSSDAYYGVADFSQLATTLQSLATQLCGGTITATKILDRDGDLAATNDQSPAEGWQFTVAGSQEITDQSGKTPAVSVTDIGPWSVIENPSQSQQDNYTFISGGCVNSNHNNVPVGTLDTSDPTHPQVTGIQLTDQDIISCVFYNKPAPANLTVIKHVVNDNQINPGTAVAGDFNIDVEETIGTSSPFSLGSFPGDESGTLVQVDGDSTYVVTETNPGAYSVDYSSECSGFMPADGNRICTVTNNDLPDTQGSLTVVKVVINNYGQPDLVSAFTLNVTDGGNYNQDVTSGLAALLDPAVYTVSESGPAGYTAAYSGDCDNQGHTVNVEAGHSYTCTITNTAIAPELTVIKHVVGGQAQASDFTMNVTGSAGGIAPPAASFPGDENGTTITLNVGAYSVDETGISDYTKELGQDCSGTIGIGEHKTCTITNTYSLPPQPTTGTLVVKKSVTNNDGGSAVSADFSIHVKSGETEVGGSPQAGSETGTTYTLEAGSYTVSETGEQTANYDQSFSESCAQGSVTVVAGQEVICTLTNDDKSSGGKTSGADLSLDKTVSNSTPNPTDTVIYTLVVRNGGPDTATGVIATDTLPSFLNFVSASSTQGTYDNTTGVWDIGTLANGASATLEITAKVNNSVGGGQQISNEGSVSAIEADPMLSNNSDTAGITIPSTSGSGGGSSGGGGGGGAAYTPPTGLVSGTSTTTSSLQMPEVPQVLGAATQLPRTGVPLPMFFLVAAALASLVDRKYKLI
jgi:uncharacterized repeat protein (TIGR01451 family)